MEKITTARKSHWPAILLVSIIAISGSLIIYNHFSIRLYYPFVTTSSGLKYKITRYSSKKKPREGDCMQLQIISRTQNNQEIHNSTKDLMPCIFSFHASFDEKNGGITEALSLLHEGEGIACQIKASDYFGGDSAQFAKVYNLEKDDLILVDLKLEKIMTEEDAKNLLLTKQEGLIASAVKKEKEQFEKDTVSIHSYLKEHNIKVQSTPSGLQYIIDQTTKGEQPQKGDIVKVNYTGRLLDGKVFDTSVIAVAKKNGCFMPQRDYVPFAFPIGMGHVIAGWDEGIMLLKKGEKGRFFIPSTLAYGEKGSGNLIPPNAILFFEVELVDIIRKKKI